MKQASINELKQIIKKVYELGKDKKYVSLMIWGPPGVGKSAAVRQASQELGVAFIDLRVAQMNPVDMRGLPTVDKVKNQAKWLTPDFFPTGGSGILFLDEMNLAPQSVMNAGYQLILDRRLGDYVVPEGWIIVAAGNRAEDSPNVTKMPPPLANRFAHIQVSSPDDGEWRTWAINNGIAEQIVAFISKMPQHLFVAPKITDKAWPSPRSWEFASHLLGVGEDIDAAVGGGTASEFRAFTKVYERIPDVDKIMKGEKVKIPEKTEMDILWATCMSLLYKAKAGATVWTNIYDFLDQVNKEFLVLMIQLFHDKSPAWAKVIRESREFDKFIKQNPDMFEQ